jgi:signal transduction histidine kinase
MKRLDKAKDDFLALISHEVRTPLTSIMGGVDFLRVIIPQASAEQRRVCEELRLMEISEIIASSGYRLRDFMNDAILMTALQSSDTRIDFAPVSLGDICELVFSGLQEELSRKGLIVENELSNVDSWQALCDRQLITTAFEKLLRNAVQHNIEGGRVRVCEVDEIPHGGAAEPLLGKSAMRELSSRPAVARWLGGHIHWRIILIYNTGPVIPPEKREALFKKFELVGRIEHHQKGSGLSLPIVQAVLENHGGRIYAESQADDGNYFYMIVPAVSGPVTLDDDLALGDELGQGLIGAAADKKVDAIADGASLDVEFEHASP